jgi:hypothetical protein
MATPSHLVSGNQPQVVAPPSVFDDDLLEYRLTPGDARRMVIDMRNAQCRDMELLPPNPKYVRRVKRIGRHRYEFVFTEAARQQRIEILFAPTKEPN